MFSSAMHLYCVAKGKKGLRKGIAKNVSVSISFTNNIVRRGPGQNRVTWKSPSRAAFVPLQDPVLAILRSPHANAGKKQYECGRTQLLFHAGHDRGITCVSKTKGLRLILIIMKHNYTVIITSKQT